MSILLLIPECKCNILQAVCVANTCNTVLTPAVGTGPGVVMWEV